VDAADPVGDESPFVSCVPLPPDVQFKVHG
jgi:hypothetical protein